MKWIVLFILLIPMVSGIDVDFSCPKEVYFDSEFVCGVNVNDVEFVYDLKIYIRGNGSGINRVWDGFGWQRSDWYVKDFINEDGDYEMGVIIHKDFLGDASGQIKIRKSGTSNTLFEDVFGIKIVGTDIEEGVEEGVETEEEESVKSEDEVNLKESVVEVKKKEIKIEETGAVVNHIKREAPKKVINLNSQGDNKEIQVVYESKNERMKNYMTYGFIFLLICIIGILLYEKKW